MPPDSNNNEDSEPSQTPSYVEQMTNQVNGLNRVYDKALDTVARIVVEAANKLNDNAAVGHVVQLTSKAVTATVDAGKQINRNVIESPTKEKMLQWTSKVASGTIDVGKQAYRGIANSPITPVVRFTGATVGSVSMLKLWANALTSRAAKKALRAASIRNSIRFFNWSQLPSSLRAAAVASGVHANNMIISGIVPGLFTVWAIYDGYELVRFTYELLQELQEEHGDGDEQAQAAESHPSKENRKDHVMRSKL